MDGVEENVNSRFIDYTKATPWEYLIADLEKGIRTWIHEGESKNESKEMEIEYLGKKYILSYESNEILPKRSFLSRTGISLWFDIPKFIVFNRVKEALTDVSERRVLFSALISALDSSRCQVPVFLTSEPLESLAYSKEILGYEIISPRATEHNAGAYCDHEPAIFQYESLILDGVNRKHAFYYLDGLSRLFGAKLWKFSSGTISISEEVVTVSAWEQYDYVPPTEYGTRERADLWGVSSATNSPSLYSTSSSSLSLSQSHSQSQSQTRYNEFNQQINQSDFSTPLDNTPPPVIQSTMEDLLAPFPDGATTFVAGDIPLARLTIQLYFENLKQSAVVDNDYYTTLLPSKLPYTSWSAEAEFSSHYVSIPSSPLDLSSPPQLSPTYSTSLRKLLALYICGKSCKPGHTYRSLSGKDGPVTVLNTEKAMHISSVLSLDTRKALFGLCKSISLPNDNNSNQFGILPQDLLMRVFSRSLWIDISEEHHGSMLYENHFGINEGKNTSNSSSKGHRDASASTTTATSNTKTNTSSNTMNSNLGGVSENTQNQKSFRKSNSSGSNAPTGSMIGKFPMPWKWLLNSGIVASPVGSWLSLVAVYTSSLNDIKSMASLWVECLDEVRHHWENRVPIPRLYPPVPISTAKSGSHPSLKKTVHSGQCNIWENPLWDDVIAKKSTTSTPFMLPDTSQCLPFQKLQMINMCIICIDESTLVDSSLAGQAAERTRSISADPTLAELAPQSIKRNESTQSDSSESLQEGNDTDCKDTATVGSLPPTKVDLTRDISHIVVPILQRRLPLMTDTSAQHKKLAKRMDTGLSRTINDNPMLKWQVSHPELLSDIRAFKAANIGVGLDDFLTWYGGMDERVDAISIQEIWDGCPPLEAKDQKPLFKAEQEAEKALGYLEGLSLTQLAASLLTSAMTSFYFMITCDIKLNSLKSMTLSDDYDEYLEFQSDLQNLEVKIREAIELVEMDTSMFGTTNHAEVSISQKTLIAIDQVCCALYDLEVLQMKLMSCRELFESQRRLMTQLCRHGTTTAENYEEAKILYNLAKSASFGGDSHSWQSFDGRELGPPTKKIFDLHCHAECDLMNIIQKSTRNEMTASSTSTTPFNTSNESVGTGPSAASMSTTPLEHSMRAILENDQLRVTFRLFEVDHAI